MSDEKSYKKLVLQHLLRRPRIFTAAYKDLLQGQFFQNYADLNWVFKTAVSYYEEYEGLIPSQPLLMELGQTPYVSLGPWLHEVYAYQESDFSDPYVQDLITTWISERAVDTLQRKLSTVDNPLSAQAVLSEAKSRLDRNPFAGVAEDNPFVNMGTMITSAKRIPTGVDFIDMAMDGGARRGEVIGFVIPTSGGKTTLGMQLADAQVRMGEHIVYLSSEQRLRGDLAIRTYTLASKGHQDNFKDGWDGVPLELLETLETIRPRWLEYFHFYDCTSLEAQTMEQVFAPVEDLINAGKKPRFVVIDWWGRMKDRIIMAQPKTMSDSQLRMLSRHLLQGVKDMSERYDVTSVVFQQLAGAVAARGPKHKPSSHSAQEDTNFNNMMDFCFTISKKDIRNRCRMFGDKARSTANNEIHLVLDGGKCMFRICQDNDRDVSGILAPPMDASNMAGTPSKAHHYIPE